MNLDIPEQKEGEILIVFPNTEHLSIEPKSAPWCAQSCVRIIVDEKERLIACQDCGRIIDPFTYIQSMARRGHAHFEELKSLRGEVTAKRAELGRLKELVAQERAKLKRANPAHELALSPTSAWRKQYRERQERKAS